MQQSARRPLKTRDTTWARGLASLLTRWKVRPNAISVFSVIVAAAGGACLVLTAIVSSPLSQAALFWGGALAMQMRLLCNLLDGMVAVEGGYKTKSGEIFNELPDRFADAIFLICAGYTLSPLWWLDEAGWLAAVLAVLTAYARALGVAAGASQHFIGPMAKPHRMAVLTAACIGQGFAVLMGSSFPVVAIALVLIIVGCAVTVLRRTFRIIRDLEGT